MPPIVSIVLRDFILIQQTTVLSAQTLFQIALAAVRLHIALPANWAISLMQPILLALNALGHVLFATQPLARNVHPAII
jgi:hypothetical protein